MMTKIFCVQLLTYLKSIGDTTVSFVNPVGALTYFNSLDV